ncbi:MAG: helix-turn-helix domain-containing protein, partial [Candidatus Omnitrophota bacterium]
FYKAMTEKLLNTKEVSQYLGISEEEIRYLVDRGELPAYRLGGTLLRFRKDQIEAIKVRGIPRIPRLEKEDVAPYTWPERFSDFLYFNDFYLIAALIVAILTVIIFYY